MIMTLTSWKTKETPFYTLSVLCLSRQCLAAEKSAFPALEIDIQVLIRPSCNFTGPVF